MLVSWKVGQLFGGQRGRILRILILFLCALAVLVCVYRVRGARIEKDQLHKNKPLKHSATNLLPSGGSSRWVIVANPGNGSEYVCSVAKVAKDAAWKTIIIGDKVECCRMPECYSIHKSQFLRMSYRTASTLRQLLESHSNKTAYREVVRNLAYIWVIHRGARHIFDAYVDEYITARVGIPAFEEELSRQLQTLALDESMALVEDKSRSRGFRNPYTHFGRPDVRLVPGGPLQPHYSHLAHRHAPSFPPINSSGKPMDFPTFRICEVRPPSIEKFLEIDEGWWDFRAPALVLPGDTMPPLCTRNTLFSPDVFWALPLLPDHDEDATDEGANNTSRIPPWYIRGLWSQSLLGDLGGSIRLTLNRVPTLQLNEDYSRGEPNVGNFSSANAKLLKRWHCKSRSTFRCLLLMAKELSKSLSLKKNDLALIEAWVIDLKSIHYAEPPMLPRRRSQTNPCLGADGLHGVTFYPALQPNPELSSEEYIAERNETLKNLIHHSVEAKEKRDKRETLWRSDLSPDLTPPESMHFSSDWTSYTQQIETSTPIYPHSFYPSAHFRDQDELDGSPSDFVRSLVIHAKNKASLLSRSGKLLPPPVYTHSHTPSFIQQEADEDFPILKAMAENMCAGFGPLIPFTPKQTQEDVLLIVVFANQHYDLIPTLEVLYRPIFPHILYCGHPHVSVDLFLRKYQTAEHRSFSFLPTYTRASYECVLGAMEMNYEVKGYVVMTDETLLKSWNFKELDKSKVWVSSSTTQDSRHVPLTKESWKNLDPRGQKLPKLLDGVLHTWKLFSSILMGHDYMDHTATNKVKRSAEAKGNISEPLDKNDGNPSWDISVPDWAPEQVDTNSTAEEGNNDEDVEIGEEEEDESAAARGVYDLISNQEVPPSSTPTLPSDSITDDMESVILATPANTDHILDNVTGVDLEVGGEETSEVTPAVPDTSVDVPLYHVEHAEPPTAHTWHKPSENESASSSTTAQTPSRSSTEQLDTGASSFVANNNEQNKLPLSTQEDNIYTKKEDSETYHPTATPTSITNAPSPSDPQTLPASTPSADELEREMEFLLDAVQDVYLNMLHVVSEYKELNESRSHEFSSEAMEPRPSLEDTKSHRISPREFRHIRCTIQDDGHQSDLCSTLRSYISTLGQNLGGEVELDYDTIPLYYLPTWATKSFYSVANVLLHFGVMDELALPLLFRGLAAESEWVNLRRSWALKVTTEENVPSHSESEEDNHAPAAHYFHPFNLHKVYSDPDKRKLFCANYLLRVFQL